MSTNAFKANYKEGTRYFWAHASTLALIHLGISHAMKIELVPLYIKRPKGKSRLQFHRIAIEVIRTEREAKERNRVWARRRELAKKREVKLSKGVTP